MMILDDLATYRNEPQLAVLVQLGAAQHLHPGFGADDGKVFAVRCIWPLLFILQNHRPIGSIFKYIRLSRSPGSLTQTLVVGVGLPAGAARGFGRFHDDVLLSLL